MENLLGLLFMIIVAIISLIKKARESSGDPMSAPRPRNYPRAEDLPEPVRQMIYGQRNIRTARPAQPTTPQQMDVDEGPTRPLVVPGRVAQPAPVQRQGMRETVTVTMRTTATNQPTQAPAMRRAPAEQRPSGPQQQMAYPQHQAPPRPAAPRTVAPQGGQRPIAPPRPPLQRQAAGRPAITRQQQQAPARQAQAAPQRADAGSRQQAQQQQARPAKQGRPQPGRKPMASSLPLHNLNQLRTAVIMSEILGPPVSMR